MKPKTSSQPRRADIPLSPLAGRGLGRGASGLSTLSPALSRQREREQEVACRDPHENRMGLK